ncbi:CD99 antigen-like 2, partial [Nestor notabilis]
FKDSDLHDGSLPKGGGGDSGGNVYWFFGSVHRETLLSILKNIYNIYVLVWFLSASQGAIAGIVSAVVATVIGAVSSFIAYQKKKLCFKQSGKNS